MPIASKFTIHSIDRNVLYMTVHSQHSFKCNLIARSASPIFFMQLAIDWVLWAKLAILCFLWSVAKLLRFEAVFDLSWASTTQTNTKCWVSLHHTYYKSTIVDVDQICPWPKLENWLCRESRQRSELVISMLLVSCSTTVSWLARFRDWFFWLLQNRK